MHITFIVRGIVFRELLMRALNTLTEELIHKIVMKPLLTEAKEQIFKFENTDSTLLIWDGESTTVTQA